MTELPGQDSQDQPGKDSPDRTARTGQLGRDCREKTV
jgi:hypothetical protein